MTAFSATLGGSIALTLTLADGRLSECVHNLTIARGHRSGVPRAMGVDRNDTRTLAGSFQLTGTSKDNLIAQLAAINAKVREGTTLTLQSTDATNTVTLNILPSRLSTPNWNDPLPELANRGLIPFAWEIEPYAYGSEQTVVNASAITAPCIVDTSAVLGDYPTPLWVYIAGNAVNIRTLYLAIVRDTTTDIDDYVREAETPGWTGGTAADLASGNARGGYYEEATGVDTESNASIVDTDMPAGTYMLLDRFYSSNGAGVFHIRVPSGVSVGSISSTPVANHLLSLATLHLPTLKTTTGGVSYHALGMYPTGAATVTNWDYHAMLPTMDGWAYYAPPITAYDDQADLTLGYDGIWYDAAGVADMTNGKSGGLMAAPGDRLLVIGVADSATGGTLAADITVKAIPRYALWA